MERCRLWFALALGMLTVLAAMGCSSAQGASDGGPLAAQANPVAALVGGIADNASTSAEPNFLSTRGNRIVDSRGNEVRITGVNWFGMETGTFAPHGLWARNWEDMLDQIASLGFNTIRLPYSNQLFEPSSKVGEG